MTKRTGTRFEGGRFGLRHSSLIRNSGFGIRHSLAGAALLWAMALMPSAAWPQTAPPASAPASAPASQEAPPDNSPLSEAEWAQALSAVRTVALDADRPAAQRGDAVVAYARLQGLRGQADDAVSVCKQVFDNPVSLEVAEAAVRAACLVQRQKDGHLAGAVALARTWKSSPGPASKQAADNVAADLARTLGHLAGLAERQFPPPPTLVALPNWAVVQPKAGPAALGFPPHKMECPAWAAPAEKGPAALQSTVLPAFTPPEYTALDGAKGPRALAVNGPVYAPPEWYARLSFGKLDK